MGYAKGGWAEKTEERAARQQFRRLKRPTIKPATVPLYIERFGYQMDSECGETWQTACLHYNKTARQVASHSENIFMPLIK